MHTAPNTLRRPASLRSQAGFTLIEVIMAVAIVGILTAVALPSYRTHVIRGALTDGINGLATMRAQMERHFQDNRTYATSGTFVTPCATTDATPRTFGNFVVSCSGTPTATAFTLQAVGATGSNVAGFTFTINQADVRTTTAPAGSGWNSCTTAWLTRRGQAC